jgi:response regulator NasT
MSNLQVAVWHRDEKVVKALISATESLGYQISARGTEGDALVQHVQADTSVGLIICGLKLGSSDAVECLLQIAAERPVPAIVVTNNESLGAVEKALEDHVMAYLIEPIRDGELRPTIHLVLRRFEQFKQLHEEVADLKESLITRKQIERAKGVIMRRSDVAEDEAYERLRRLAMDSRIKLVEAADKILKVEATYGK